MISLSGRLWRARHGAPSLEHPVAMTEVLRDVRGLREGTLLDAKLFSDMPIFVERLNRAVSNGETIGIFGDYDCDGVTSAALWTRALRRRGQEPVVRLPHRVRDGYGLQPRHVDELHAQGVTLLISVDTGITAYEAAERAKALGIDLCIVDHHAAKEPLPTATAIVHPVRALPLPAPPSAATLSFAMIDAWEGNVWPDRDTDLALAAIGTVADVMPLLESNRALVVAGLDALSRATGPLKELLTLSGIDERCTARDIAFGIAPRINAAGRMDDPTLALKAVLEGGDSLRELCLLNTQRQDQVEILFRSLLTTLGLDTDTVPADLPSFLFAASTDYPPGIIGLLAGKLTEKTGRPSLIGSIAGDTVTGSLRSTPQFSVVDALDRARDSLLHYGGHTQAAGCTFSIEKKDDLHRSLLAHATVQMTADDLLPSRFYDLSLSSARTLTTDVIHSLRTLEPFGTGNPEPCVLLKGRLLDSARRVGGDSTHLQARIEGIPAIGFGLGRFAEHTTAPLDVLCRLSVNTWNGKTTPQLMIDDLRIPLS